MSNNEVVITKEMVEKQGLSMEEYERIKKWLGREPNFTELGMFSAMWSEHCSYKNSKPILKLFPTKGKQVIQGPGENAGVVDIGGGLGVVFKVESHNHPSAVEPYAASATGGGGCIRDIFTMGAKPIGLLDSLRLGSLEDKHVRFLFKNIVRGFTDYANLVGLPVLGGEIYFDDSYAGNPLVNAMTVGIVRNKAIIKARAKGAKPKNVKKILQIAKKNKTPVAIIGEVGGNKLVINRLVNLSVNDLYKAWHNAIENHLKD